MSVIRGSDNELILLGYLKANRIKQTDVAKLLSISKVTVNRKLNGSAEFSRTELKIMHDKLNIPYNILMK